MALNKFTQIGNSGFGTDTSINTTGIVTAASFSGDGSGLTGITALGSGVVVQEEGSNVGTAQTINFIGTGVTATFSGGIASVEIATSGGGGGGLSDVVSDTTPQLGGNLDLNSNNITGTGDISITGDATFSGDLDVDGHVNLDNVSIAGVSTFAGITTVTGNTLFTKQLSTTGISTFRSSVDIVNGSIKLKTPTDNDVFSISYSAANDDVTFRFDQTGGTGGSQVQFDLRDNAAFRIKNINTAGTIAKFTADGNNELYYDDSKKFETTNTGAIVTGTLVATATTATNVTVANEASDTECFVMFGVSATGDNAPKSSSSLKYNSSTGGLTAGSFIGDGSGLTGITASGSGVIIRDDGSLVGTAGTIDFGTNVSVSPISAGVVTVTASAGSIPGISTSQTTQLNNLTVAGVSTFTGDIDANGNIVLGDTEAIHVGAGIDLRILHSGGDSVINHAGTDGEFALLTTNEVRITNTGYAKTAAVFKPAGETQLYHNHSKKFETTNTGAVVTGILTATTFSGSGASLTNLPAANLTGTLPAISGANLTTLNASELDSGTIPDARFPATLPAVSGANLTNLPASGISTAFTNVQATWSVGGDTSGYTFTGPGQDGAEQNPDIYLVRGQRYRFINTTGTGHPFRIQSDTSGTAYTDGVSGSQSGTQDFNVQHDAPVRLYYQCTIHSGMIGNIYIVGGSDWRMTDVLTNQTPEIFTNLNVGIGTDNPQEKLHVLGTSDFVVDTDTSGLRIGSYGEYDIALVTGRNTSANSSRVYIESGDGEHLRITSSGVKQVKNGNLNINSTYIDFSGDVSTPSTAAAIFRPADNTLAFSTANVERLRITSGGDVGINTTSNNDGAHFQHYQSEVRHQSFQSTNGDLAIVTDNNTNPAAYIKGTGSADLLRVFDNTTQVFTIKDGGNVEVNGNIVMGNGDGIDFSATANGTTSSSELFDDYEEGAWTPSITLGGGSTGMAYSRQEGHYTKIGRQVIAQFRITLTSKGSSGGQLRINGLPFTSADVFSSTGIDGQVHIAHDNGFNAGNVSDGAVSGYVEGGTSYFLLTRRDTNASLDTMTNTFIDNDLSISGTVIFYA